MENDEENISDQRYRSTGNIGLSMKRSSKTETKCMHPSKLAHRLLVLFLVLLFAFGQLYVFDSPAAVISSLSEALKLNKLEYNLFYLVIGVVNFFAAFGAGYFIDKFGLKVGGLLMGFLVFSGQLVLALGAHFAMFWVMLGGRIVYALGAEGVIVTQNSAIVKWFKPEQGQSVALALVATNEGLAGFLSFIITPLIAKWLGYDISFFFGAIICFVSLCSFATYCLLDFRADKIWAKERDQGEEGTKEEDSESIRLSDLKQFGLVFWTTMIICFLYYGTIYSFVAVVGDYIQQSYHYSEKRADFTIALLFGVSAVNAPLVGVFIHRIGCAAILVLVAQTVGVGVLLGFLAHLPPLLLIIVMGFVNSSVTPSILYIIPQLVPPNTIGTAYGTALSSISLGIALGSSGTGYFLDRWGWHFVFYTWIGQVGLSILCAVTINILKGRQLNFHATSSEDPIDQYHTPLLTSNDLAINKETE